MRRGSRSPVAFSPRFGFCEIAARGIWLEIKEGAVLGGLVGAVPAGIFGAAIGAVAGAVVGLFGAIVLAPVVAR